MPGENNITIRQTVLTPWIYLRTAMYQDLFAGQNFFPEVFTNAPIRHHGSLLRERDDKSLFTGCKTVEDASEELNPQKNLDLLRLPSFRQCSQQWQ